MKLYYAKGACSLAPRIIINELQIPCEFESVDLKNKTTANGGDFLKINPKGSVPVIETQDKQILTENAVILQYLADSQHANQLLPPTTDFNRYRVLEWLNYVATEMHKGCGPLFNTAVPQEIKDQTFIPLLKKKLDYIEKNLEKTQFIAGNEFTLPDAYLFTILRWFKNFNIDITQWKKVSEYVNNLKKRNSIQKSLQEEGLES
jgi:glutathione S-transferase